MYNFSKLIRTHLKATFDDRDKYQAFLATTESLCSTKYPSSVFSKLFQVLVQPLEYSLLFLPLSDSRTGYNGMGTSIHIYCFFLFTSKRMRLF